MSTSNALHSNVDAHKTLSIIGSEAATLEFEYSDFELRHQQPLPPIENQIQPFEHIGTGGIGIVFSAHQPQLERTVAIKQLKRDASRAALSKLLEHEAKITGRLEHPNILPIYMYGCIQGQPTIVMKRLEGETWSAQLKRRTYTGDAHELIPLLRVLQEVGKAVDYAHRHHIIHRDIKPDNIHLGHHGEVFLLDWGLAIEVGKSSIFPDSVLIGTPAYMPPEMAHMEVHRQDARTDIYLLGASLYEAIFGQSPHRGENIPEILERIRQKHPLHLPKELPSVLKSLLLRCLASEPEDRYPDMSAFLAALESTKTTLQYLSFIRNIRQQAELIQAAIRHSLGDWKDNLESMVLSYQALREEYYDKELEMRIQETLKMAIVQEIDRNNIAYARRTYERLPQPDLDLDNRLMAAEQKEQETLSIYSEWQKQNNPSAGLSYRLWASGILTIVWGVIAWLLFSLPQIEYRPSWGWGITLLVFAVFHKGFRVTAHNRTISFSIGMLVLCTLSGAILASALELPFAARMAFVQMSYGIALALMGLLIAPVFWMAAIPFWASSFLVAYFPEYNDVWTALSKSLAFGGMSLYWLQKDPSAVRLSFDAVA